jgi:YbbR domain-containing protein
MRVRRLWRLLIGAIVHNWPLKLGAIVLASLLYVGFVAAQGSNTLPGPIPVFAINPPDGAIVTTQPRPLEEIRYVAPADLGHLTADDFHATVDLTNVPPTGAPTSVPVSVTAVDPRVQILDVSPRTVEVVLDTKVSAPVSVNVVRGPAPPGVEVGTTTYTPQQVTVSGPSTDVNRVVSVRVDVVFDPSGFDYDQEVAGTPVDASGEQVTGVELSPRTVHVVIPLYKNKQSRSVPVNPILSGEPAPGFRVAAIDVEPLSVTLEGDADQLAQLTAADTAPVPIYGATRDISQNVAFALPTGITAVGSGTVRVTVHLEPVTETRTFTAGLRIDGGNPALQYSLSVDSVLLTVYGSTADLDRLSSTAITVGLDVSGLTPGKHELNVIPSLPSGVSVVAINPSTVTVTITAPPSASPAAQLKSELPSPVAPAPSSSP